MGARAARKTTGGGDSVGLRAVQEQRKQARSGRFSGFDEFWQKFSRNDFGSVWGVGGRISDSMFRHV